MSHEDHAHGRKLGLLDWIGIVIAALIIGALIYHQEVYSNAEHGGGHETVASAGQDHAGELDSHAGQVGAATKPNQQVSEDDRAGDAHADDHGHAAEAPEADAHEGGHGAEHGPRPPLWAIFPFVCILLSIAVLPLIPATAHWWESNKNRLAVALAFAVITLLYYFSSSGATKVVHVLEHAILGEYIPFIVLLFALYVISGGISLRGDLPAHPLTNTIFLFVGTALASFIGTTGASMLLIRPLLQTNRERKHVKHTVIFFIFLISNIGGCLLPIGDPPLFLGYLRGVPFLWTLGLWPEWLLASGMLLAIYYVWDTLAYRKEELRDIVLDESIRVPLQLRGSLNFVWLVGVVLCVALVKPGEPLPVLGLVPFPFMREMLMLVLVVVAFVTTGPQIRADNSFNYHAILEVAALFVGIFISMQVPIEILAASGEQLRPLLSGPHAFYWATGALSSFLDNAPTYVVFMQTAQAMTEPGATHVLPLNYGGPIVIELLRAISLGAVFMGAMSYIGNGPNFMVKSIAEQSGVRMPSFFGYMLYSVLILTPVFVVVTMIFL